MSATDAAISLIITALRADSVLSLPHGTGEGQHPAGVGGEVYPASSDSTDENMFPKNTAFPAIAIIPLSSINTTSGTGKIVMTSGVVMVKIVTIGMNATAAEMIAERVAPIVMTIRNRTWARGTGQPRYRATVRSLANDQFQPTTMFGDRLYRYKNLVFQTVGHPFGIAP